MSSRSEQRRSDEPDAAPVPEGRADRASPRGRAAAPRAVRALVVDAADSSRLAAVRALRAASVEAEGVNTVAKARAALRRSAAQPFDVAIVDCSLPGGGAENLARELAPTGPGAVKVIMTASGANAKDMLAALRAGAVDLVVRPCDPADLVARALAGARAAIAERARAAEAERLRRTCKRLSASRKQIARQVNSLCNDLADAYQELADQMTNAAIQTEFAALVRQELDVESLLRTCLEFILARTGPTNAALFLPSNHSDFALGAYVNYDCPKDSADVLLDHLADTLAPKMQDESTVVRMDSDEALERRLGEDAHWLEGCDVLVFSCRHDGDCLAVGALFRDRKNPFCEDTALQLKTISDIFARQLARVVKIHHRHRPEDAWPGFEREEDDGGGLAA